MILSLSVLGGCDDERVTLGECRRATITAGVKYRGSSRGLGTSDNNSAARKPRVHTGPLCYVVEGAQKKPEWGTSAFA